VADDRYVNYVSILATMYVKLAHREEKEVLAEFGETYRRYTASTPGFFPRLKRPTKSAFRVG